jgi:hypothetical protein
LKRIFFLGAVLWCVGCAQVRPHERERLAHPGMRAPAWPQVGQGDEHVFLIREGTTGATGQASGGCGCN